MIKALVAAIVVMGSGLLAGQSAAPPAVYTREQAAAGRTALQMNSFGACADCHTTHLTGRSGEIDELPPLGSLPDDVQKGISNAHGKIPALAGPKFMMRWGVRTTKDLSTDFTRRFASKLSEETRLNIVAYLLEMNGAVAGAEPLTMATDVELGTLIPR